MTKKGVLKTLSGLILIVLIFIFAALGTYHIITAITLSYLLSGFEVLIICLAAILYFIFAVGIGGIVFMLFSK